MNKTLSDENIRILSRSPLFSEIDLNNIEPMLICLNARIKHFEKEAYIFRAGDPVKDVGVVLNGKVIIIKENYWGNRSIISKFGASDVFAEAFSCAETAHIPLSVVATEHCDIMFVDYQRIITTCTSACIFHTRLINNIIRMLAQKNIMLTQKIEHYLCRTTRDKLLSYLSAQAIKQNSHTFDIPFDRQELADYLSVDRSAMSSELGKLRDEGILEFKKNHFTLQKI